MQEILRSILFLYSRHEDEKFGNLTVFLEEKGYRVDITQHIEETDTFLDRGTYDMLLMDITDFSVGDCVRLFQRIRNLKTNLIVITDYPDEKQYREIMNIRKFIHLYKPVDSKLLKIIVERCME